jgi:hypothetical protein
MPEIENIVIVPSLSALARAFDARMTPPYDSGDARSEAETVVLNNVRMAWKNGDQIPIPAGTSAEGAVVHVLSNAARDCGLYGSDLPKPFTGARDLWDESGALTSPAPSPFHLIEKENDWNVRVFAFDAQEVRAALADLDSRLHSMSDDELEASVGEDAAVVARTYFED